MTRHPDRPGGDSGPRRRARARTRALRPVLGTIVLLGTAVPGLASQPSASGSAPTINARFAQLPLYFVENRGQTDPRVGYYVSGGRLSAYFATDGITLALARNAADDSSARGFSFPPSPERWTLKLDFLGANAGVRPQGEERTPAVVSYFTGDRASWNTDLATYGSVVYRDLWPGIDLVYTGTSSRLKYTFVVRPGADPSRIQLGYRGASAVHVTDAGRLAVTTPVGGFEDEAPYAYQELGPERIEVHAAYALRAGPEGTRAYGFEVGAYDTSRPLILDPVVLAYCGFIGGSASDGGTGIAVDGSGNAYVVGETISTAATFPDAVGPDLSHNGGPFDVFVAKVNAAGTALVYAGYLGGTSNDYGRGIAVDGFGNAYVTGYTNSNNFPVSLGPDGTANGGFDAFVAKVNASGNGLVYSGYVGGALSDEGHGIAVDGSGNAYITGLTSSNNLPVAIGPDSTFNGGGDAFVAKVNATGALSYCGYVGGSSGETGRAIAVDGSGAAYVTGETWSADFPAVGGPDLTYNTAIDAFIVKVNAGGTGLAYSGYIGGAAPDYGYAVAVDGSGNAYVAGVTNSSEATFPVAVGPDLTYNGMADGFIAKVSSSGTGLVYCGYVGGSAADTATGIALDASRNAFVGGRTSSSDLPMTVGPDLASAGGLTDAFVTKVNATGDAVLWSGYVGGTADDYGYGVAVDGFGNVYLAGSTASTESSFPVKGGPDPTFNGTGDAFVAKIIFALDAPPLVTTDTGSTISVSAAYSFELSFASAANGGIQTFHDLAEDPGGTTDLVGGSGDRQAMHYDALQVGGSWYGSYGPDAGTMHLLEATPTRVRVRSEGFYKQALGSTILGGVKGFGDYSVYPSGRVALRWDRQATSGLTYTLAELGLSLHRTAGTLDNWTPYSQTDGSFANPGTDAFLLARSDVALARTDFLHVMDKDWTVANGHQETSEATQWNPSASFTNEWAVLHWQENTGRAIPARSSEVWNFLTYLKPTSLGTNADAPVTSRSADYRSPAAPLPSPGSIWQDAAENSGPGDAFNESEAAYVFDVDPASGLTFTMNASGASPRYHPFFKIRQWRSLGGPTSVTLTPPGTPLTADDYRANAKPISRAHFAQDVRFHSTLEDTVASLGSPDVGLASSATGGSAVPARYGNGFQVGGSGNDYVNIQLANFNLAKGAMELWYQPTYASTDGTTHNIAGFFNGGNDQILLQKTNANTLVFSITASGVASTYTIAAGNFSWRANDWVHLRLEWDESVGCAPACVGQQRILVNGVEPPHTDPTADYVAANLNTGGVPFILGRQRIGGPNVFSPGTYDEVYVYGGASTTPTLLAYGGLKEHANEYLADPTHPAKNFTLALDGVIGGRMGEYFYLGSDSKLRGLNVALQRAGSAAGVTAADLVWEYWDGTAWANLKTAVGVGNFTDETNGFTEPTGAVYWTADPASWSPYSVNGGPDLYYLRLHLASGASYGATPPIESAIKTDILLFQYAGDLTADTTFAFGPPLPTAVELMSFEATGADSAVDLTWRTGSELDNLGFHLHRSSSPDGPWTRITSSIIEGLGSSPLGASYSWRDAGLVNGTTYHYRLEDLDTASQSTFHGPVSAVPSTAPSPPGEAGGGSGGGDGAEGGVSEPVTHSCPPWVLAVAPDEVSPTCTRYGDPDSTSLEVLARDASSATLELRTGGFWTLHDGSGTIRVFVRGLEHPSDPTAPALPLRRALVEAAVGKRVELVSGEALDVRVFQAPRPSAVGIAEMAVGRDGTARPARRSVAPPPVSRGYVPRDVARLAGTVFQGERKSAVIEMTPVRFAGSGLVLAGSVRVKLAFTGVEERERGTRSRGRSLPRRNSPRDVEAQLYTSRRGLHAVAFEQLFPGRGRGLSTTLLRLQRQGEAVAFHVEPVGPVFGPGSTLFFFADRTAASTAYSSEVAYELVHSEGVKMALAPSAPAGDILPSPSVRSVSFETNRIYQPGLLEAPDPWLWQAAPSTAPPPPPVAFSLDGLATGSAETARLVVQLQGASGSGLAAEHHVRLSVNGVDVGETTFAGKRPHRVEALVPASLLREGANELSLTNVGDTGVSSLVFLDRFAVSYPQASLARGGVFEGAWGQDGTVEVGGLTASPVVLDVTGSVRWVTGFQAGPGSVRFQAEGAHIYLVASPEGLLSPRLGQASSPTLRDTTNQADYLVIAPSEMLEAAAPLVERRRSQGLSSRAVAFESIASQFGHGQPSAEAIRAFLSYAWHSWRRPSPRYVLLLGDSTVDPQRFVKGSPASPLPAYWARTSYLWTVSDPALGAVNGEDLLPDLAVGRLPATTVAEAQALVAKLLAWEDSGQDLEGNACLVADNPDVAGDFEANAEDIRASFLSGRAAAILEIRELGAAARPAILGAFDEGASLMSYVGHGGTAVWAGENVLNNWDVPSLRAQSRQPLLLTMNCLNGYFVATGLDSLAEALVKAPGRGAIAAISPSGLSLDEPAHQYHRALMAELASGTHARLGDAILDAQKTYAESGLMPELLGVYHLLGDPATRLR